MRPKGLRHSHRRAFTESSPVSRGGRPATRAYTGQVRPWLLYTLIRVVLFAGIFALLSLTQLPVWLSAVIAAIAGLCISFIFFRPQRDAVAASIVARRERGDVNADAEEDERLDRAE